MTADGGPQYDPFAADFERHATDSAYNAYYDRPALLDLLGDVSGKAVLDAGCGPGLYAEELLRRGAAVTAFDESDEMVRLARQRLGDGADVRRGSLAEPLSWLPDGSQDLAVMALVLHHLDDRVSALREVLRVLRPGRPARALDHAPDLRLAREGRWLLRCRPVEEIWQRDWSVRYWRQPLEGWCAEFAAAGFVIERLVEPRPVPAMAERYPEVHRKLTDEPGFIVFQLLKIG